MGENQGTAGIAETVGNAITFKILTEKRKIIYRSVV
jgi:hypothetical protein